MKKIVTVILIAAFLLPLLPAMQIDVSAESLYIHKIVSVVYDDSGSMTSNDKMKYASYAMQAFCGMLNSDDKLFITYMGSFHESHEVDLSSDNIQKSIDSIKSHQYYGGTPYKAVENAYNKLKSVNDSNPNTQYWLVVITDGQFSGISGTDELNTNINSYAESVMPNGTNPKVTFLTIGNDTPGIDSNEPKGIYSFKAADEGKIIEAMSQMADRVSGRTRLNKEEIVQVSSDTIKVSSSIPLLNIAVLSQGSGAQITQAICNGDINIPISRKVALGVEGMYSLQGSAFLLGDSQSVIGKGNYTIKFNQSINVNNIVVLFEPALEVRMKVLYNGREVTDHGKLNELSEGDKISLSCKVYEMGTNTEIDSSLLPPDTDFEVEIFENDKFIRKVYGESMTLNDFELKNVKTEIKASAKIKGFNPVSYSLKFTPKKYVYKPTYTLSAEYKNNENSIKFSDIESNKNFSIYFNVFADGVKVTDIEQIKNIYPVVKTSLDGNGGITDYTADGKIKFTPNKVKAPDNVSTGSFDVDVVCSVDGGAKATASYKVIMPKYSVKAEVINGKNGIKFSNITSNKDLIVEFTVYCDGALVTDIAKVKSLNPKIQITPEGNDGKTEYTDDGKIRFTPNKAKAPENSALDGFNVDVTCSIDGEAPASATYKVLMPAYTIKAELLNGKDSIKFNDVASNKDLAIEFTVYCDGVAVTDVDKIKSLKPTVKLLPDGNAGEIDFTPDGKIIFKPNAVKAPPNSNDSFDVEVALNLKGTAVGSIKYRVIMPVYTVSADYLNGLKAVNIENISENNDLKLVFTVFVDGKAITDSEMIKLLLPSIEITEGNDGQIEYTKDGKILFTPKKASVVGGKYEDFDVQVSLMLNGVKMSTISYSVDVPAYRIVVSDKIDSIRKTEFYGNSEGLSFYVVKDGKNLDKNAVEDYISVKLGDSHKELMLNVTVADDGLVTVAPYSEKEHKLNFISWFGNWCHYFGLNGKDIELSIEHPYCNHSEIINVVGETAKYQILNVYLPLILEILILAAIIAYIIRYVTKPRFADNGVLYVGTIESNRRNPGTHNLSLREVHLKRYNKFKNLWNPFKDLSANIDGISITAYKGNKIKCNEKFPWYSSNIQPKLRTITINSPRDVVEYCNENDTLLIRDIKPTDIMDEQNPVISQDDTVYYFVDANTESTKVGGNKQMEIISDAKVICYHVI